MREHKYELMVARILDNKTSQKETLLRFLIVAKGEIKEISPLEVGKVVKDLKDLYVELRERGE